MSAIHVLGAGSWGTAAALVLTANGHDVTLVTRDAARSEEIQRTRENARYLPGVMLPSELSVAAMESVRSEPEVLVLAVPSHVYRAVAIEAARRWSDVPLLVSLTKGLEADTQCRMTEVLAETFPTNTTARVVVLAGPSHAEEVGRGVPTAVVAASHDADAASRVQALFMRPVFRVYTNTELAVALKNVIALAAGLGDGLGLGDNAKGALVTRGLAEITRVGVTLGGRRETFFGLAGVGDLVTTCISRLSRNRRVGEEIARGRSLDDVLAGMHQVAEGVRTTVAVRGLAARHALDVPIAEQVYAVLFANRSPREAITALMTRDPRAED